MSDFGFASWGANGAPNNYGIKPICVIGSVDLLAGQQSGSYSFSIPSGYKIGYIVSLGDFTYTETRRSITASGSTISIGTAGSNTYGPGIYAADKSTVVVFLEKI